MAHTSQSTARIPTDYTTGPLYPAILKMGLPSMFGFLAQHIYAMADMFWVSRLEAGESGVAAITFFTNLSWLLFSFNHLIGPGSVAVISRRYGEKAYDSAEAAIKETLLLKLGAGVLLGAFGWFFLDELLTILGAEGEAFSMAVDYGLIMMYGLPVMFATYTIFTGMRSVANPKLSMYLMISSNILNIALDPFFIFGWAGLPAMGIKGAAIASVISYGLTVIIGYILFSTGLTNVRLHLVGRESMSLRSAWKILRIGIPSWLGSLSFSGARLLLTPIVASFGMATVAAYGSGLQLFGFGIMVLVGFGLGLSSLIGHNLGAGKPERAKATADRALLIGVAVMAALGLFCLFGGRFYMDIFFDDPGTIAIGVEFLRIMAVSLPFFGLFIMLEQVHAGVGLNTPTMVVDIIHAWLFQLAPAFVVTQFLGMDQTAVWYTFAASGILSSTGFYWYYRRGKWLTVKV